MTPLPVKPIAALEDADQAMWRDISARIRARREAEQAEIEAHNAALDWSWLPERCPECRLSWGLFPPARIHLGGGKQTGEVRCVDCKHVYSPPGAQ